jgi:hypothetical protein
MVSQKLAVDRTFHGAESIRIALENTSGHHHICCYSYAKVLTVRQDVSYRMSTIGFRAELVPNV